MGIIVFNGKSSADYHIQVEHPPGYETPERDYEVVHVPGRNGDVIISKNSYKNVTRSYEIAIGSLRRRFSDMANDISEWLHSAVGYARLEDSYEPEYYRMAAYREKMEIENILFHGGRVTINFDCKPQRFLKSGDKVTTFTQRGILKNPTNQTAAPILKIFGTGAGLLNVGGFVVNVKDIKTSVIVNSEIQDAYSTSGSGLTNRNGDVALGKGFPMLEPGQTEISFSGGITSVEVTPKWWTL